MKKVKIGLLAFLIAGLSFSVLAWHNRKLMTPAQESAIFSLTNRFIDSGCRRPSDLAEIFEGSIIPTSILNKSKEFLSEQLMVEGECFGRPITEFQEHALETIQKMPRSLIDSHMTSEIAVGEFLDCLVEVERSFYSLQIATRKIFTCIDRHLDIRGFWHEMLDEIRPGEETPPINYVTLLPPHTFQQCLENCSSQHLNTDALNYCYEDCSLNYGGFLPAYDVQPMPEPTNDIVPGAATSPLIDK